MTNIKASTSELADKAYSIAWREFRKIETSTPDVSRQDDCVGTFKS